MEVAPLLFLRGVFEFDGERVVVAGLDAAFFHAEGPEVVAPVEHLVDVKPHEVEIIGHHRAESGLGVGVAKIVAPDQPVGVGFGHVVEIAAY